MGWNVESWGFDHTFSFPPHFPWFKTKHMKTCGWAKICHAEPQPLWVALLATYTNGWCYSIFKTISVHAQKEWKLQENLISKNCQCTIFNLETEYNIVTHFSQKHSIFNAFPFYPNTKRQKLMAFLVEWRNWSNHSARKKPYLAKLQKDLFT